MHISRKESQCITYMEVCGSNRVIYRVTADSLTCQGGTRTAYGVMVEDMRTGEREYIADFSADLERTIRFANDLVQQEIRPSGLFDVALRYLSEEMYTAGGQAYASDSRRIFSR